MLRILRASLRTGRVTTQYPNQSYSEGCRSRPVVDPALCSLSGRCAGVCPSGAITVSQPSSDERRWQLDLARCLFCGLCEEACPRGAIKMTDDFELATRARDDLIIGVTHARNGRARAGEWESIANQTAGPPWSEGNGADASGGGRTNVSHLGSRIQSLLKRSLHIRHMAAGSDNSSDWEIAHLLNPIYDVQRLGIDFVASPRHADLLMVTGAVTRHLEPALRATYEAMPSPRLVVAVGSEACGGGVLQGSYAVAGGVDRCLPVDVYIPGDPPRPQALIQGLLIAVDRLQPKLRRVELTSVV